MISNLKVWHDGSTDKVLIITNVRIRVQTFSIHSGPCECGILSVIPALVRQRQDTHGVLASRTSGNVKLWFQ